VATVLLSEQEAAELREALDGMLPASGAAA